MKELFFYASHFLHLKKRMLTAVASAGTDTSIVITYVKQQERLIVKKYFHHTC